MLLWALAYIAIAGLVAVFLLTGEERAVPGVAHVLLVVFLALFGVSLYLGLIRRGPRV